MRLHRCARRCPGCAGEMRDLAEGICLDAAALGGSTQERGAGTVGFMLFVARCMWMARRRVATGAAPGAAKSQGWYANGVLG